MLFQVICPQKQLVTLGALDLPFLCVSEDVLLEVLPAHEELLAVIALEVLLPGVNDHVRLQVSLLRERFVTEGAAIILLTCVDLEVCP